MSPKSTSHLCRFKKAYTQVCELLELMVEFHSKVIGAVKDDGYYIGSGIELAEGVCRDELPNFSEKILGAKEALQICRTDLLIANSDFRPKERFSPGFELYHDIPISAAQTLRSTMTEVADEDFDRNFSYQTFVGQKIFFERHEIEFFTTLTREASRLDELIRSEIEFEYVRALKAFQERSPVSELLVNESKQNSTLNATPSEVSKQHSSYQEFDTAENKLNARQREILVFLYSLQAFSKDDSQNADDIAANTIDTRATSNAIKTDMRILKAAALVEAKSGRGGGYWLKREGIELATQFKKMSKQ